MAVLHFPTRHRGQPSARQMALARRGFRWQPRAGLWRRDKLMLSDSAIDGMAEATFTALLAHLDGQGCGCCHRQWVRGLSVEGGDQGC
jgi:hypothetical protein